MVRALFLGAASGTTIAALAGCVKLDWYFVVGGQGAMLGPLLRLWIGWPASKPGRARRLLLVPIAGVLCFTAEFYLYQLATGEPRRDPAVWTWWSELTEALLVSLFAAAAPAFLLAAWAERTSLRPGWGWWIARGLGSAAFGAVVSATGFDLIMSLSYGHFSSYASVWDPVDMLWHFIQEPGFLLAALAPTTLLALVLGADSRWRVRGGSGTPGAAALRSPAEPAPTESPERDAGLDFVPHPA